MKNQDDKQPTVEITAGNTGSLKIKGLFKLITPDGKEHIMEACSICRCGRSKNQPFCDGSHRQIQ